jgi:hypothetical protein
MSKKTRRKSQQPAKLETAPPPVTLNSSARSLWRRSGLFIALGLFVFANLALRLVDTRTLAPTAFGMIAALTFLSLALALTYGVQYILTSSRATRDGWRKEDWERWRNGY